MIKKIIQGYKNLFFSVGKIFFLLLLCTGFGAAIVLPLWKFATVQPKAYTVTILAIILLFLSIITISRVKSRGPGVFFNHLVKFLLILLSLGAIFQLVLHGKRIFVIPVILAFIVLYGMVSFGFRKSAENKK